MKEKIEELKKIKEQIVATVVSIDPERVSAREHNLVSIQLRDICFTIFDYFNQEGIIGQTDRQPETLKKKLKPFHLKLFR